MKKIMLFVMSVILVIGLMACGKQTITTPQNRPSTENQPSSSNDDNIVINEMEGMAHAKLMVESKEVLKDELPDEIKYLADKSIIEGMPLSMISSYYTKSDYEKEEFDILHDYVLLFFDENSDKSVKISASNVEKPLRDYFFTSLEEASVVNGKELTIYHYEDKYIVNFEKNPWNIDIETNALTEEEVMKLLKNILS